MADPDDLFTIYDEYDDANFSDYNYDGLEPNIAQQYDGLAPSLEAQIDKCVDDFEPGQVSSCGINERELRQAMLDTQTGLLNCYALKHTNGNLPMVIMEASTDQKNFHVIMSRTQFNTPLRHIKAEKM